MNGCIRADLFEATKGLKVELKSARYVVHDTERAMSRDSVWHASAMGMRGHWIVA
jgi:hypothetical protein